MALSIFPSPRSTSPSHTSPSLTCPDKLILFSSPPRHQSTIPRSLWQHIVPSTPAAWCPIRTTSFFLQPVSYFIIPGLHVPPFIWPASVYVCVCVWERKIYLQSVFGQGLGSFHDDLLDPLNWQVTSSLLQTLTEEANHLKGHMRGNSRSQHRTHTCLIEMICYASIKSD